MVKGKLVETFLFSEAHERDLLLLKFQLSNGYIHEWVISENAYSFQGDYKGLIARSIIEGDERFAPYRQKVKIIENEKQFSVIDKSQVQDDLAFKCEHWQRELVKDYFLQHYDNNDWLILHDVDEMIDFTDEDRQKEFFKKMGESSDGFLSIPRLKYAYDFDNQFKHLYVSVLYTKQYLLDHPDQSLVYLRSKYPYLKGIRDKGMKGWNNVLAFEFSSCYKLDAIVRKQDTNSHTGISRSDLQQALRCNHRTVRRSDISLKLRPNSWFYFEKVKLDKNNSPAVVRDNLSAYKTYNVEENYEQNRRLDYPEFYTLRYRYITTVKHYLNDKSKRTRRRIRSVLKMLKLIA